jgi:glycerol-3-phosphate acyltransferase PlsX
LTITSTQVNAPVRIVLDAMGGDFSPTNEVLGAIEALNTAPGKIHVVLAGDKTKIEAAIKVAGASNRTDLEILSTTEVIGMDDEPVAALRQKRDSSIVRGFDLVKTGDSQAFVSAGNTGAVMSGATLLLGRIKGCSRPTIGSQFPRAEGGFTLVFDVGATVDSKPIHLLEYAVIGSIYAREMFNVANPIVGILSVGEEKSKGNELVFLAAELLEKADADGRINFAGNVEGRDVLKSTVDVIVCDGFVGNVVLKFAESIVGGIRTRIVAYSKTGLLNKLKAGIVASVFRVIFRDYDYQEYGGVPLLGVKGVAIIGHGRSTPRAIKNMVLKAHEMVERKINDKIAAALASNEQAPISTGINVEE